MKESEEIFKTLDDPLVSSPELVPLNLVVSLDDCLCWLEDLDLDWLELLFID